MRMQQRRKTAATWTGNNEQLLDGELGIESDTGKWKLGDGSTLWNALPYQPSNSGITAAISAAVANLVNGAPGAVDTLKELADALGDDPNFATTVTNALATKANTSSLGTAATHPATDFDAAGAAATAQAYAIQRGNHTGTQPASTVTGLATVATTGSKADVGLGNVDNTSDANKPVSTAQATADGLRLQYRGAWTASTAYVANDAVTYQGALYRAGSAFTSGTSFTAANWTALNQPLPGQMATGYYYLTTSPGGSGSSAVTNGNIRLHPWVVTNPVTITRAGAEVVTAGTTGTVVRIGFYTDSGGLPGSLLLDAGTVAGDVAGIPEITGLSLTLQPGVYWVAVVAQGGSPTMRINGTISQPVPMPVAAMVTNHTISCLSVTTLYTSGGLPTTIGAWSAAAAHTRVYVKV